MGKGFLLYLICATVVAISRKPSVPIELDIILSVMFDTRLEYK